MGCMEKAIHREESWLIKRGKSSVLVSGAPMHSYGMQF